jgi:hypothetical protein
MLFDESRAKLFHTSTSRNSPFRLNTEYRVAVAWLEPYPHSKPRDRGTWKRYRKIGGGRMYKARAREAERLITRPGKKGSDGPPTDETDTSGAASEGE